jgi:hypothetical protein
MLLNENTIIEGDKCMLVPYTRDLVEQYHNWFVTDPSLLEATGSELLTLDEEYENQDSWRTDESKLTFLIKDITNKHYEKFSSPLCGDINCFIFSKYIFSNVNPVIFRTLMFTMIFIFVEWKKRTS